MVQPLLYPSRLLYGVTAAKAEVSARQLIANRRGEKLASNAAMVYLQVLAIEAKIKATGAYVGSLHARLGEVEEMLATGCALESDMLKLRLAFVQGEQNLR